MPPPAGGRKGRPYNSQGTCFLYGLIPRRRRSTLARMVSALPWQICLVFPRLDLPWAMHGSHLCLAPGHDPRLEGRSADPQVAYLLAQSDAPEAALSPEAQADFVAACALSCLLPGGLDALDSRGDGEPQIHAGAFSGRPLDAESAPEQPEESLAPEGKLTAPLGDLLEALFTRWTRHHVEGDGRRGWEGTALFRSAAMALRACSPFPGRPGCRVNDEGAALIFWTSACEVLFSRQERSAAWRKVLSRVRGMAWEDPRLRGENYIIQSDWSDGSYVIQCGNLVERLFKDLFDAKERYLEGSRTDPEQGHVLKDPTRPRLTQAAPALYLICLRDFLGLPVDPSPGGPHGVEELLLNIQDLSRQKNSTGV